ncbi:MAG: hypothetical protein IJB57_03905 [Clostridia bacterium]|nr:hypothetical protein [Clostridia bacterium]
MLKFIVGLKGAGKTKEIVAQANTAVKETNGCVAFIEKGTKLIHELDKKIRLADTEEYGVANACSLYGMVVGMYASNHDITHIFIDSALKIVDNDVDALANLAEKLNSFSEKNGVTVVATNSIAKEDLPESAQKYV